VKMGDDQLPLANRAAQEHAVLGDRGDDQLPPANKAVQELSPTPSVCLPISQIYNFAHFSASIFNTGHVRISCSVSFGGDGSPSSRQYTCSPASPSRHHFGN